MILWRVPKGLVATRHHWKWFWYDAVCKHNVVQRIYALRQKYWPIFVRHSNWYDALIQLAPLFTRGQFWPSGIVIACICVSVRVSVCVYQSLACPHDNSSAAQPRITKFGTETWKSNFTSFWARPHDNLSPVKLESPNWDQKCILVWLRSILILGAINLQLQYHF